MLEHCPGHEHRDGIMDEAIGTVLATVDMAVVLERTGRLLRKYFGATRLAIHRCVDERPGTAETILVDDPRAKGREPGARFALDGSLTGDAVREKRPVTLDHLEPGNPRYREEALLGAMGYGAVAVFPLLFEGAAFGALEIAHAREEGLLDCCMQTASRVSGLIAIALQNSRRVDEVRRLNALLRRENAHLKQEVQRARGEARYIADSPVMRSVIDPVR
ncbi:MAG: GAF domain-containing protein, partial [Deltaproteobacteria bacterium]|nr:GAF domain-containing protein [Deltaproteobacteria bacterium]